VDKWVRECALKHSGPKSPLVTLLEGAVADVTVDRDLPRTVTDNLVEGVEIVLRDSPTARRFLMDSLLDMADAWAEEFAEDAVDAAAAAWREFEERMRKPAPEPALAAAGGE
jgi:hypothetical protein